VRNSTRLPRMIAGQMAILEKDRRDAHAAAGIGDAYRDTTTKQASALSAKDDPSMQIVTHVASKAQRAVASRQTRGSEDSVCGSRNSREREDRRMLKATSRERRDDRERDVDGCGTRRLRYHG